MQSKKQMQRKVKAMAEKEKINPEEEEMFFPLIPWEKIPELTEEGEKRAEARRQRWAKLSDEELKRLTGGGRLKNTDKED